MTQYLELALDWNRGAGYTPHIGPRNDTDVAAALEVPCTDGVTTARGDYAAGAAAAEARGMIVIASHTLTENAAPADQAAALAALIGNPARPVMLLPSTNPYAGVLDDMMATADHMTHLGLHPKLVYFPAWYWAAVGGSDLFGPMVMRRLEIIAEPGGRLIGNPGDDSSWWDPAYGGFRKQTTTFLRYDDYDGNPYAAFRGTLPELRALLGLPAAAAGVDQGPPEPVGVAPVVDPPAAAA